MAKHIKDPVTADTNLCAIDAGKQIVSCMTEFGKYVIEDRAVPDYRDGCKPSQRRILFGSYKFLGIRDSGKLVKSARITGEVMGRLHPHGDQSLYSTLVNMTHTRYPMVDGTHANFGDLRNPAGAPRYTECRFTKVSMENFRDLDVAATVPNYSGDDLEPIVINTRLPLLLMNGASGIAVGMSTNIPPHNLSEVVDALVYTAKHMKTVTCDDLLQFVKGPDFANGGSIVSKASEIAEFYRTGFGKIVYQCGYTFNRTDTVTEIVVTEFPDAFNIDGFIEKCNDLREKKEIKSILARTEGPRYNKRLTIRIGVDNKTSMGKVISMLRCSESYQFNVTERREDETELMSMTLVTWAKQWIRWRRLEEEKMLLLEEKNLRAALHKEILRLKGIINIDTVLAAVKQSKQEPAEYLADALGITLDDASFIGSIPVFQLKKANADDQRSKIHKLKDEINRVLDDLDNLTRVIVKHLQELKPYFDERRTKLNVRGPQLSKFETTGDPVIVAASTDGKLFSHVDEKSSTASDLYAVGTFAGAVLFARSGMVCYLSPSEMVGRASAAYRDNVGLAAQECKYILGLGVNGNCIKLPMQQRKPEFPLIKNTDLMFGGGINENSKLLVWGAHGEFEILPNDKIPEASRSNVAGTRLTKFKPMYALVVNEGQSLYTIDGSSVAMARAQDVTPEECFALSDRNIVFLKSGRRKILDRQQTIKTLASNDVKSFYSVTVSE